jgi:hypothetical protein
MSMGFTDRSWLVPTDTEERQRPVLVACRVLERREKAVLVQEPSGGTAWLPRSEIRVEPSAGGLVRITMPTWLAIEKGLTAEAGVGQGRLF